MNDKLETKVISSPIREEMKQAFTNTLLLSMPLLAGMWSSQAHAVPTIAVVNGEIEKITINDVNDHWSGGVIVAGGQNIVIPKNLLMDLPANRLTLKQLFDEASASCKTQAETGLAKGDKCNKSGTGGIATIHATRLDNGNVIAGDVLIEKAAEAVVGQVSYINYTEGYFRVNGNPDGTGGVMVRLNDPDSRHTIQSGAGCKTGSLNCSPDPRFTLDGDNYTNVFSTGYPMCIPSTQARSFSDILVLGATTAQAVADGTGDVLCPRNNRPANNTTPVADSRRFAPILVGDNVTAEGNYETVNGVRFLSAHSTMVGSALSTSAAAGQPDYLFLDEVEVDVPGFQNQRARTLIIGYATLAPADVMIWGIHYDPVNNAPHEFPLATTAGCDNAAGAGECTAQGLVPGAGAAGNIFKIRHDVDFAVATKLRADPCAHLRADPRFTDVNACSQNGGSIAEQFAILSPIPHEIQARTGTKFASMEPGGTPLISVDINGNEATNGQYLFPFGMGLGGISTPEMNEINLDAMATPLSFTGIPWNLDRRLSPGGCIDIDNDGDVDCESSIQPLSPFPFEGAAMDPRTLGNLPSVSYADPNFTTGTLSSVRDRILSYVNPTAARLGGNGIGVNSDGNFTTATLAWNANSTPPVPGSHGGDPITYTPHVDLGQSGGLICSNETEFNSPPFAHNDSESTIEGVAKTILVLSNDSDVNGDTLTVIGVSSSANSTVSVSTATSQGGLAELNLDGTITFTPAANFSGVDTFIYTVSDGTASVTGTVTITVVASSNNPPVASTDSATVLEDGSVVIDILTNDTDDNSGTGSSILSIASVSTPAKGTVAISGDAGVNKDQKVTYTPKPNANGSDTFSYVVADGQGGTDTATVTVTITAVNDAPVAAPETANVAQGLTTVINVLDNDSDIDSANLTVNLASQAVLPAKGTVTTNGTTVSYTANAAATGADTFSYSVSDGELTATATVTVNIIVPTQDAVTFSVLPEFRISKSEWRANGTGNADGKTITLRLGTAANGAIVGTGPVTLGVWTVRVKPGISPNGNTQVTAWSTGGGHVTSNLSIRN